MNGFWVSGIMVYTAVILIANVKIAQVSYNVSLIVYLVMAGSIVFYFVLLFIFNAYSEIPLFQDNIYFGTITKFYYNPNMWHGLFAMLSLIHI